MLEEVEAQAAESALGRAEADKAAAVESGDAAGIAKAEKTLVDAEAVGSREGAWYAEAVVG